jgi:hypothetical protein
LITQLLALDAGTLGRPKAVRHRTGARQMGAVQLSVSQADHGVCVT